MKLNNWLYNSLGVDQSLDKAESSLRKYVKRFNKRQTLLALWEVQRLQNRRDSTPPRIEGLPPGGLGQSISDGKPYFFPWIIEQSINVISIFGQDHDSCGQTLDPFIWSNLANLYNHVHRYNDARSGKFLETNDVFETMSKICRQQFPWQDGSLGSSTMELYATLYLGDKCNQACQQNHQIRADDFLAYGFILISQFYSNPYLQMPYDLSLFDGDQKILKQVLDRYSLSSNLFAQRCRTLRKKDVFGEYSKSLFRLKPIIRLGDGMYFCPMPSLLQFRITAGLISETSYSGEAINEVGDNFEGYCFEKFTSAFPDTKAKREEVYGTRKRPKKTPDVRLYLNDVPQLIVECKATLLRFEDKFENVNLEALPNKAEQISKGVLQVWKYVRDIQDGTAPDKNIAHDCKGLVLTLDEWITMDKGRHELLLKEAHEKADKENIPQSARVKTVIGSVKDIFYLLEHAEFEEILKCLEVAKGPEFNGYVLYNVFREQYKDRARLRNLVSNDYIKSKIWYWEHAELAKDDE